MRSTSDTQGFSLVEVLIATAIIGILLVIGARFFRQADDGRAVGKARENARTVNDQLQKLIERDLRFRDVLVPVVVSADQKVLTLTRRQALDMSDLTSADETYTIRFATVCRPVPAELSGYADLSAQLTGPGFTNAGDCLKAVKCAAGELPRVEITVPTTGRIPPYPQKVFPSPALISKSFRNHAVASAACFVEADDQIRITVDSVYPISKDLYAPLSQDKSFSLNSADFKMLPQEHQL
ncbi:PulJ/GspJ family protein [Oligoflexus tunisiensis]|uniref:PulJ/GspJ family protein n=1 Tax=Oligoflexus tunisiensis TaxID=708132 RepID=UPI00114D0895|nr:prepilin-type N-terminal cleavage/methylation domain-containing protein [Oligoflexus tunisiensis]